MDQPLERAPGSLEELLQLVVERGLIDTYHRDCGHTSITIHGETRVLGDHQVYALLSSALYDWCQEAALRGE